jgi:hypothetical protein
MRASRLLGIGVLLGLSAGLSACHPPPLAPPDATAEAVSNITSALRETETLIRSQPGLADRLAGAVRMHPLLAFSEAFLGPSLRLPDAALDALDARLARLRRIVTERVLVPENLESVEPTGPVYHLLPEPTCRVLDGDEVDQTCARVLGEVEVRVALTVAGSSQRLQVLIGPQRVNPASLSLSQAFVRLNVDLAQLSPLLPLLAAGLGHPTFMPGTARGMFDLALGRTSERGLELTARLLTDVQLASADGAFSLAIGESAPLFTIIASDPFSEVSFAVRPGNIDIVTPWKPAGCAPGDLHVHLTGFDSMGSYRESQSRFNVAVQSFGPDFIEVRGQRVLEVDVKSGVGDPFFITLENAMGGPFPGELALRIRPQLDATAPFALAPIAAELPHPPPAHLLDERYRLTVIGSDPESTVGATIDGVARLGRGDPAQVTRGTFSLTSNKVSEPVTATDGQCITRREPPPGAHPVLGAWEVLACCN